MALRCLPVLLCLFLLAPAWAPAQVFPLYDQYRSFDRDDPTTETWVLYPFFRDTKTTQSVTRAFHPIIADYRDDTGRRDVDALWPIFTYRYRPERGSAANYEQTLLFPLYWEKSEERFGRQRHDRFILPFWYQGTQEGTGKYYVLFPFFWYAYPEARIPLPLFPRRPQMFAALWPIAGDFRGYFNRDRITFFLWPLFVHSSEGTGEDYNQIHSFIWPIFARHSGPKVSGFRIFPLFGYVRKEDEFRRIFFLWPLGHYRTGRISKDNPDEQNVFMFVPFYTRFRRDNISLDTYFPFYGRLQVGERISEGYALAFYNRDRNYRDGMLDERIGWFIYRRRTPLPGWTEEDIADHVTTGGGVFPIYTRFTSRVRSRGVFLWPLGHYKYNEYRDYTWRRTYFVPFYSNQRREFADGNYVYNRFIFPFFRERRTLDGVEQKNALHLFFYTFIGPMDRLYAPLWTFWETKHNTKTGASTTRYFKNAWIRERLEDGSVKTQANLFLLNYENIERPDQPKEGSTRLLFGLIERKRDPEHAFKVLGLKLF